MQRAMETAATGMFAQELKLDVLANNLANVNTTGFKRSRSEFQDLLYETLRSPGAPAGDGNQIPTGLQVGHGTKAAATLREFTSGSLKQTGNSLDFAIEGDGFFQIIKPSGEISYSRDGSMKIDSQGRLVNLDGYLVQPTLIFPAGTREVRVATDGTVTIVQDGQTQAVEVGKIELAKFANSAGLEAVGHNLYMPTAASGDALIGAPGTEGLGVVSQGFLEMSNVRVVEEMIDLIATQRAYETNSKVIQAADEMLRSTANIR